MVKKKIKAKTFIQRRKPHYVEKLYAMIRMGVASAYLFTFW